MQAQIGIWQDIGLLRVAPILALIIIFDAVTNLSGAAAAKCGVAKHREPFLLLTTMLAASGLFFVFSSEPLSPVFVHYIRLADTQAAIDRGRSVTFYRILVLGIVIFSVPFVLALAKFLRRSWVVWLPLAFLGNVGGLVWLLSNYKEFKARRLL